MRQATYFPMTDGGVFSQEPDFGCLSRMLPSPTKPCWRSSIGFVGLGGSAAMRNQHLVALRRFFDRLVDRQVRLDSIAFR
jgi:hypothetical protein